MPLHRFWVRFDDLPPDVPPVLQLGCGVTAADEADCMALIRSAVFDGRKLPPIISIVCDLDVRTLDDRHVRPNMGNPAVRGIWFPLGYAL